MKDLINITPKNIMKLVLPLIIPAAVLFFSGDISRMVSQKIKDNRLSNLKIVDNTLQEQKRRFFSKLVNANLDEASVNQSYSRLINTNFVSSLYTAEPVYEPARQTLSRNEANEKQPLPKLPEYSISSVYLGGQMKFAVINGKIYKTGDKIGTETLAAIKKEKLLLTSTRGKRWLNVQR